MRSANLKKILFGFALFLLGIQVSSSLFATFLIDWMFLRNTDTISLVWVKNHADYERLIAILKGHGYNYEPWPPNAVAGDAVIYGDIRPLAPLIAEVASGRISVFTKRFEPSLQSFIPLIPWGGATTVFSTTAALLSTLLWAAALVAVAWYVASRRILSLYATLLIVFVPQLLYVAELGYVIATGDAAWLALLLITSALAPPTFLLLGFAIAKVRRA
jgi:hypothetical protein